MTKSKSVSVALMLLLSLSMAGEAVAQKKQKPVPKAKPVMCAVVQIDGEYDVVVKTEVAALKKKLAGEHKRALADHKAAKAAAKKNKEKFTDPQPKARKLKLIKASIEQSKAHALVTKLKEKDAKKNAKKTKPKRG